MLLKKESDRGGTAMSCDGIEDDAARGTVKFKCVAPRKERRKGGRKRKEGQGKKDKEKRKSKEGKKG